MKNFTFLEQMIRVCDGNNKTRNVSLAELRKELLQFAPNRKIGPAEICDYPNADDRYSQSGYFFRYRDFKCSVYFDDCGIFCGRIDDVDPKLSDFLSEYEMIFPSEINGIYQPHGGFVDRNTFFCNTNNDLKFNTYNFDMDPAWFRVDNSEGTFKTANFVELELRKVIDSIISKC